MQYKLINDLKGVPYSVLKIDDDNKRYGIPFNLDNTDYQAYLKYKEEGGKVYGADENV
jgi:hypothetical protein